MVSIEVMPLTSNAPTWRSVPVARRAIANATLAAATVLMGLIAGFFYAWACSVMIGLANVDDRTFIHAMQEINAVVRNAWFAPAFFGSLIVPALAAMQFGALGDRRRALWCVAGFACYLAAFVITMAVNVPLNDQLADAGPVDRIADLAAVRDDFEGPWVRWNIARTVAATLGLICLVRAVALPTRRA